MKVKFGQARRLPKFREFASTVPLRMSHTTEDGKFYERDGSLFIFGGHLFLRANFGCRGAGLKGVYYLTSNPTIQGVVEDAINGRGVYLGDPCNIVFKGDRAFLHLSVSKERFAFGSPNRVLGVDVGWAKYFVACFAVEVDGDDMRYLGSMKITSGDFRAKLKEYSVAIPSVMSKVMARFGGARRGQKFVERSRLGESKYRIFTRELCYFTVNRIIEFAKKHECHVIAVEDLKNWKNRIKWMKRKSKTLGRKYNMLRKQGLHREAEEILRQKHQLDGMIRKLSRFPYGKLLEDLKNEAEWNGMKVVKAYPAWTSQECPRCGHRAKENRQTRGQFRCVNCGFTMQADLLACINIVKRTMIRT